MAALNATIQNLLNIATGIGLMACAWFICLAGYKFMTSGGSPSAIESAKSAAFNACLGFALVLAARVIANVIQGAVALG
jgi:multisubunit Na+/H+ antiporter MnhC subunit